MDICRVVGTVVSTQKVEKLMGFKLQILEVLDPISLESTGALFVGADLVNAGKDDIVLVVRGSSARQSVFTDKKPVDTAVVGVIDHIEAYGKKQFDKYPSMSESN